MKTLLSAIALIATLGAAACGDGTSTLSSPTGPTPAAGSAGASGLDTMRGNGMGNMGGGGMGNMPGRIGGGGNLPGGMGMAVGSEFEYLAEMIPHHVEAIATARLLQQGTERPEMRRFAETIIETQSAEVEQMTQWLAAWYPGRDTRVSYQPMMRELAGLGGDALDRAFLEDMIPHHMMAVMMSQQLLASGAAEHDVVLPFAANIRDTQRREIQMMSMWLRAWFGASAGMH